LSLCIREDTQKQEESWVGTMPPSGRRGGEGLKIIMSPYY